MNRSKALALTPGKLHAPTLPLARYRQPWISGTVRAFAESTSSPGSAVLVLGNGHGNTIRELLDAGRKVIALNPNPLPLLWMHCQLNPVHLESIQSAVNTIAYSEYANLRLVQYAQQAYETDCPKCRHRTQIHSLLWDRETQRPFEREIDCPHCGKSGTYPITEADYAKHSTFQSKIRASHALILQRIAPHGSFFHQRAEELLELYTPRNLTVLGAIIRQFSFISEDADVKRVIACLLLHALDRGSQLNPVSDLGGHPRSLKPANSYYEHNVWLAFNEAFQEYENLLSTANPATVPGTNLATLLGSQDPGYVLLARRLDYLRSHIETHSISHVIWQLDPPDAVFTSLSTLWTGWLWGAGSIKSMQEFAERRRHDLPWFEVQLESQCEVIKSLVADDARIVLIFPKTVPDVISASRRVFDRAGFELLQWISTEAGSSYLLYQKGDFDHTHQQPAPHIVEHAHTLIEAQHQPMPISLITATYAISWPHAPPPNIRSLYDHNQLTIQDERVWDLSQSTALAPPLYDQVENTIVKYLRNQRIWLHPDLHQAIYAHYNGLHSPNPDLVQTCIDSYAIQDENDQVTLRSEDAEHVRDMDIIQNRYLLQTLGTRLQYSVSGAPNGDTIWQDGANTAYRFRVITHGMIAAHLLQEPPQCEGRRCLVIPGGRAGLIAYKLARDPSLRVPLEKKIWTFIKFRHLRRMAEEITERATIEVFLGLDPIAEQSQAQIPMLLQ